MPSERSGPVAGVVLAAGTSTRMGQNKLFCSSTANRWSAALSAGRRPPASIR